MVITIIYSFFLFCMLGLIPILAIGKAVSMVLDSINSDTEVNTGFQLLESWRVHNLDLGNVYKKQDELNEQGWFTVINNEAEDINLYEIVVYSKN